jgi:hypothetical protein
MKNFYDLPDTSTLTVSIDLELVVANGYPDVTVTVNREVLHQGAMTKSLQFRHKVDVRAALSISIKLKDQVYEAQNSAVIINNISVDNKEIMPQYNYLANYSNDMDINTPTSMLEFNGVWSVDTEQPFLWWLHEVSGKGWLLKPWSF